MGFALTTFPLAYGPDFDSSNAPVVRTLKTDFGDGYGLRVGDGLHTIRDVWTLTWSNLLITEGNDTLNYLIAAGGSAAFDWTAPGATSSQKWICDKWQWSLSDPAAGVLSATFTEVFDL